MTGLHSLPHAVEACLQVLVSGVHPPHHAQVLLPLLLHEVAQQTLQLVVLVIPRAEHVETRRDHLLKLVIRDMHQSPRAKNLEIKNYFINFLTNICNK